MEPNCRSRYHLKITADQRVYTDWKKHGSAPIEIKYADNCKQCKRHRKNIKKRKYEVYKEHKKQQSQQKQQVQLQQYSKHKMNVMANHHHHGGPYVSDNKKIHFMKVSTTTPLPSSPHGGKLDWDPHMTMTSPVDWETSPLVSQSSGPDSDPSSPQNNTQKQLFPTGVPLTPHKPDIMLQWEDKHHLPDVISNNEATAQQDTIQDQKSSKSIFCQHDAKEGTPKPSKQKSIVGTASQCKQQQQQQQQNGEAKFVSNNMNSNDNSGSEHFIIVNVPKNVFTDPHNLDANKNLHDDTLVSIADDTATVASEGVKCRYCLVNDTLNNEPLISPCHCCGTSKFVHQSCLEKWLTLRNLDGCEVCKMEYRTKWVHRPLCSLNFPSMKKHDVFLLGVTVAFYITLIFQFLGIVYISIMASALSSMVTIVTLVALSLGLLWFLSGSIALTIILYASKYWKAWRKANKKKTIILSGEDDSRHNNQQQSVLQDSPSKNGFPRDLSHAVAV